MTALSIPTAARGLLRWPDVSLRSLRVWQRNRDVYLRLWKSELVWPLVEPLITLLALGVGLGGLVDLESGEPYIEFIAPGLLAVWPMWSAAAECGWGTFFRMESQHTFDAIVTTPVSVEDVITGEILWGATRGLISTVYILAVIIAFGLVDSPLALLVIPVAMLPGLMFAAISLTYTSVAWSVSSLNYFFAVFITPMFWLAGVFFPIERLPEWAQKLAWFLPATHAVNVYRGLTSGDVGWSHLGDIAWMVVVLAIFYATSLALMRRRLVK